MPYRAYKRAVGMKSLGADTIWKIKKAREIMEEYAKQGFDLTLRQLYYQFVSLDLISNNEREYKNLGQAIDQGRMYGLIDWEQLVDRTRNVRKNPHWDSPASIVRACSEQFRLDLWVNQDVAIEVWVEKEALIGVVEPTCEQWDVPFFACKGYVSQSEMWSAAQRIGTYLDADRRPIILHLGDHDPSGLDMTRDIGDRIARFVAYDYGHVREEADSFDEKFGIQNAAERFEVRRIALNRDQIRKYNPPPNPAKQTDARFAAYREQTGLDQSWELDALKPTTIAELIETEILSEYDEDRWNDAVAKQDEGRAELKKAAEVLEKKRKKK